MSKIVYKGCFAYPPVLHSISDELAVLRSKMSKDVYAKGTEKYRGKREHELSSFGILGELIARDFLSLRPIKFTSAPLVDFRPVVEPDIVVNVEYEKTRIDVKAVKKYGDKFLINHPAHNNENKRVDFYWFVKIEDNFQARHYLVKVTEVNSWEVKQFSYTKAYFHKIPSI